VIDYITENYSDLVLYFAVKTDDHDHSDFHLRNKLVESKFGLNVDLESDPIRDIFRNVIYERNFHLRNVVKFTPHKCLTSGERMYLAGKLSRLMKKLRENKVIKFDFVPPCFNRCKYESFPLTFSS
jgi:hypothetical protein